MEKINLVASPRCGGHWLLMIIDLYFKNQSPSQFIYGQKNNHLCKHTHDGKLKEKYKDVIYLYREVVDKIYSEMVYYYKNPIYRDGGKKIYYNENIHDIKNIKNQVIQYANHLVKWLLEDRAPNKTIIYYDNLINDFPTEFKKVCLHFKKTDINIKKALRVSSYKKEDVKSRIQVGVASDNRIINISNEYENNRETFRNKHKDFIYNTLFNYNKNLNTFFDEY